MSRTRWAVDDPDGTIEIDGRKFGHNDEGAPMLCNLVCKSIGRHVHIDYCRANEPTQCRGPELLHISARMTPNPQREKDWISHSLYWKRTGEHAPGVVVI